MKKSRTVILKLSFCKEKKQNNNVLDLILSSILNDRMINEFKNEIIYMKQTWNKHIFNNDFAFLQKMWCINRAKSQ